MENYHKNLHQGADPKLFEYAREMRNDGTKAEAILWLRLKSRQVKGWKFRRQHPLSRFIADFYCHEKKLVVELDGSVHDSKEHQEMDKVRTGILNEMGIKVIRFRNEEVIENVEIVVAKIINAAEACE
jgi:very-short-patch-repair endonuclease